MANPYVCDMGWEMYKLGDKMRETPVVGEEVEVWYGTEWKKGKVAAVNAAVNRFGVDIGIGYNNLCFIDKEDADWRRVKKEALPVTEGGYWDCNDEELPSVTDFGDRLRWLIKRLRELKSGWSGCPEIAAVEIIKELQQKLKAAEERTTYLSRRLTDEINKVVELQDWKDSAMDSRAAWDPIWNWACSHKDAKLGCSVPELVMELIRKMEGQVERRTELLRSCRFNAITSNDLFGSILRELENG